MKWLSIGLIALCVSIQLNAQRIVTGVITDTDGVALIGVNVLEQGTSNGTITDLDGKFSLQVAGPNSVLQITYTGLQPISLPVGNDNNFNIEMEEDAQLLGEVVVSALGYETRKDESGSTSSVIGTEQIQRSGEAMVLNSLAAKASNVEILSTNGDPGAGVNFRIRGANTIEGSSNPLIIVDGIPISNSTIYTGGASLTGSRSGGVSQQSRLNDLNPADIESIQVLKGASAASLWGSRAANGVLVITTKNGKSGRPKITYSASLSLDEVSERMPMQNTYGKGRDGVYDERSSRAEAWGDRIADRAGGADDVDQSGEYFEAADGTLYYPLANRNVKNSRETFVDENWNSVFQTGHFLQHDLSISGGTERATFYFSLGRIDQDGIIRGSEYNKTNIRLNNKMIFNDWLSMSTKAGYISSHGNRIQQNSNTSGLLLGLLRTPPDFDQRDYIGTYYNDDGVATPRAHRSYRNLLGSSINPGYTNPLWSLYEQKNTTDVDRFIVSSELNATPNSWLTFTLRGGVDSYSDRRITFFPIGSADSDTRNGAYGEDVVAETEINFDAIARGNFKLADKIGLTATVGWNINDRSRDINESLLQGFLVNSTKITTDLNTASEASSISKTRRLIRSNRGYGVLAFDLFDRLFINVSGATEAVSSVDGNFFYPSIDGAWQFVKSSNKDLLSFGKLRASWGQVGIQPFAHRGQTLPEGGFAYSTYSDGVSINQFGGGFRIDNTGNDPNLRPELKTEWEIGTDLRFFSDKLSLNMTYYQNEIKDMLLFVETSPSSGFEQIYTNAGSMENKGFETEIDYLAVQNNDWNINVFGNFATNENLVTDLKGVTSVDIGAGQSVSSRAVVGEPLGVLWSTSAQRNPDGSYVLNDNGFPIITSSEGIVGDPNPDWRAGLGFAVSWKKLTLSALFDHQQGGDFSFRTLFVLGRFGTTAETAVETMLEQDIVNYDGDIFPAGTLVRGNIYDFGGGPVLRDEAWYRTGPGGGFGDGKIYEFGIYDATNTRLRELSLSYTLDSPWFRNKTKISGITFTATGRNLFLWDNLEGIDPQVNQFGVGNSRGLDYFTNPSTKSVLFSLRITY
ncbi:SusC/RagA family TonB-linked outer membrane protein [Flavilitoribacter nigricans]|nr:SusC/RagA family TonB-linked outer membrane protein [Flavilitoribacter nigricans]